MLLYAPPFWNASVLQSLLSWEARCALIGQLSSELGLAKYLKHVMEMLRPSPYCDAMSWHDDTKTIQHIINEAFVASSGGMVTDYSGLCLFKHYHVCILGVARYMYSYQTCHGMDLSVQCMRPYDEYRQSTPNPEGAPAVMQHFLITASASRRIANAVSCVLETVTMCWFWTRLSHGLAKASHMDWQELCARVSYLSHSAQIQIFHNISMLAM